jgi:hypothetical protein
MTEDVLVKGYTWLRNGQPILGATENAYTSVFEDGASRLSLRAVFFRPGFAEATVESNELQLPGAYLVSTPKPTVGGEPFAGRTLTANVGLWDAGVALAYQWLRDGQAIVGANSPSYVLVGDDVGSAISVSVTGSRSGYYSNTQTSLATATVGFGAQVLTPTPTISGTAKVGETLTVLPGTWDSGASLTYQWLRNGTAITGATAPTYVLQVADLNYAMAVAVTSARNGFTSVIKTSAVSSAVGLGTISPVGTISVVSDFLASVASQWNADSRRHRGRLFISIRGR